ncbi:DUF4314 domain-containing protein [[Clostridium] fimetarium]|uniref:DUF4314 domain-containing protein n=1 Tax=[Clostridium] fimetarium TaxID=99656 RepID=A0A1I0RDI1_9FIRM|nr:DUF4314 domain-containing protein [[Clostridium] fimetarium]SEW38917.1 protein of unknown function [[Clostridium] fimetarium]
MQQLSKNQLEELYPKGMVLQLTERIDDPYSPKEVGDIFTVKCADDNMQLHGSWKSGGSIAIVVGKDKFISV